MFFKTRWHFHACDVVRFWYFDTHVCDHLQGKTAEEIRKLFNIKNDFTPEEEEQIRQENKWAEES